MIGALIFMFFCPYSPTTVARSIRREMPALRNDIGNPLRTIIQFPMQRLLEKRRRGGFRMRFNRAKIMCRRHRLSSTCYVVWSLLPTGLGSTETLFPYVDLFDPNYISAARVGAKQALARVGLDAEKLRAAVTGRSGFASLTGGFTPRPAQATVGETDLEAQLLILEAETGAGKTEAALWRFVQLLEAGAVDSLYFALPTRAAARQIHGRVCRAMANVFGTSAPEPILSIPGYLKAGQAEGQALPGWRVRWGR